MPPKRVLCAFRVLEKEHQCHKGSSRNLETNKDDNSE